MKNRVLPGPEAPPLPKHEGPQAVDVHNRRARIQHVPDEFAQIAARPAFRAGDILSLSPIPPSETVLIEIRASRGTNMRLRTHRSCRPRRFAQSLTLPLPVPF